VFMNVEFSPGYRTYDSCLVRYSKSALYQSVRGSTEGEKKEKKRKGVLTGVGLHIAPAGRKKKKGGGCEPLTSNGLLQDWNAKKEGGGQKKRKEEEGLCFSTGRNRAIDRVRDSSGT